MALNGLQCADVPLRNYSLTHSPQVPQVMAEAGEGLIRRLNEWRSSVGSGGVRVNVDADKVVVGGERRRPVWKAAGWLCGVCG